MARTVLAAVVVVVAYNIWVSMLGRSYNLYGSLYNTTEQGRARDQHGFQSTSAVKVYYIYLPVTQAGVNGKRLRLGLQIGKYLLKY